jgi:uncharacterized membrane protein
MWQESHIIKGESKMYLVFVLFFLTGILAILTLIQCIQIRLMKMEMNKRLKVIKRYAKGDKKEEAKEKIQNTLKCFENSKIVEW